MSRHLTRQQVLEATRAGWYLFESPAAILEALPTTRRTFLRVAVSGAGGLLVAIATASVDPRAVRGDGRIPAACLASRRSGRYRHHLGLEPRHGRGHQDVAADDGRRGARRRLDAGAAGERAARPALRRAGRRRVGRDVEQLAPPPPGRRRRPPSPARRPRLPSGASTPATCTTSLGRVQHQASGRSATYGALAERAAALTVPETVPLKDHTAFTLIGTRRVGRDNAAIVQGRPLFGLDVRKPGMRFAAIAKSPVFGGAPVRVDEARALEVPGVERVVTIDGLDNPTHPHARRGGGRRPARGRRSRAATRSTVQWGEGRFAGESTASLRRQADAVTDRGADDAARLGRCRGGDRGGAVRHRRPVRCRRSSPMPRSNRTTAPPTCGTASAGSRDRCRCRRRADRWWRRRSA